MLKIVQTIGWFLIALPAGAADQIDKIPLGDGMELTIQESPYHRGVPHSCYDQAMESIKNLYPDNDVLLARRFGTFGEATYSLVCYKQSKGSSKVIVGGMLAAGRVSWRFSSEVPTESFDDSLGLILEANSKLGSSPTLGGGFPNQYAGWKGLMVNDSGAAAQCICFVVLYCWSA